MARYENILDTIGGTPLVRIQKLAPQGINLYVKLEAFNPMGSVKDRMARALIEDAENRGDLRPGQTVIEATSGNTGIGLAMVCAQKGYPLVVTMGEQASLERRKLLRFLGAQVVLTPAETKGTGMLRKAEELATRHGYYLCRQFANEANAEVHTRTTAREILADFEHESLHYFLSGFGTGGTLKGVARGLKNSDPNIRVIAVEPDNSALLGSGISQPRAEDGSPMASHPGFRPHLMQGWSPDFISSLTEEAMSAGLIDDIETVSGEQALQLSRELACREGIFAGISSGATLAAALQVAQRVPAGSNIVCMLPDTGERYLSTPLFDDIAQEMNEAEQALSSSTPSCRFQAAPPVASERQPESEVELDFGASRYVSQVLEDHPVCMFSLAWCDFCWTARKLFKAMGIEYKSVDLDSVEFQDSDRGGRIRQVLAHTTGSPTIPQIFIGGRHLGGCTDLFDAYNSGELQERLRLLNIPHDDQCKVRTESLLPQWLHPRKSA